MIAKHPFSEFQPKDDGIPKERPKKEQKLKGPWVKGLWERAREGDPLGQNHVVLRRRSHGALDRIVREGIICALLPSGLQAPAWLLPPKIAVGSSC